MLELHGAAEYLSGVGVEARRTRRRGRPSGTNPAYGKVSWTPSFSASVESSKAFVI